MVRRVAFVSTAAPALVTGGIHGAISQIEALVRAGIPAVWATPTGDRPTWFASTAPTLALDDLGPEDVLVFEEGNGELLRYFAGWPNEKRVFLQSQYLAFQGVEDGGSYAAYGVSAILALGPSAGAFCERRFPDLPVAVVPPLVDPLFQPRLRKRMQIAFVPRKRTWEAEVIRDYFRATHPRHRDLEWVEITNRTRAEVAAIVAESGVFLSLSRLESFGLTTLEAMATGAIAAGFTGGGGDAYATPENGFWAPEDDLFAAADQLARACDLARAADAAYQAMANAAVDTARRYDQAAFDRAIVAYWREALAAPARPPVPVRWTGEPFTFASLSLVNRELARALVGSRRAAIEFYAPRRQEFDPLQDPRYADLARSLRALEVPPAVTVRHQWPPNFEAPAAGAWVVIQPWEFGGLPDAWIPHLRDRVDEYWVPSRWVKDCAVRSGVPAEKIQVIPNGVDTRFFRPDGPQYPLKTTKAFKFLFVGGLLGRKGIDAALNAYMSAFTAADDVCLVIKASGGKTHYRGAAEGLLAQLETAMADPRTAAIELIDDDLSAEDVAALYRSCDVLVHPYRGEGFGLPIAEAMASGIPPITTAYGPALEFCDEASAYLVPATLAPLPNDDPEIRSSAGRWWAEPDLGVLAAAMRQAHADPATARAIGRQARRKIQDRFRWEHAAGLAMKRLEVLAARTPARELPPPPPPPTVRWTGFIFNPSGYADESRHMVEALAERGVPVTLRPVGLAVESFREGLRPMMRLALDAAIARPDGPVDIAVMNAVTEAFHRSPLARYHIGRTMFETDGLPPAIVARCNALDELWLPSEFNLRTFREAGVTARLHKIPEGVDHRHFRPGLAPLPIPGARGRVFLSVFEWSARKGWDVLLDAWGRAFGPEDDVSLVLRTYGFGRPLGGDGADTMASIRAFLASRGHMDVAPIVVLDRTLDDTEMPRLYAAASALVAPSRGEGWGRPQMEAMACGLPVLATDWSGSTEYMTRDNALLIDVEAMEPAGGLDAYLGQLWARASAEHLARLLRDVADRPEAAAAVGRRARADVEARWTWGHATDQMIARLEAVRAGLTPSRAPA